MAGRTRRTRILVLIVFGAIAFVLYNRHSTPVNAYREYYSSKEPVGGGAVIRPQHGEAPPPAPAAPDPDPWVSSPPNPLIPQGPEPSSLAPAPVGPEKQTSTTTTSPKTSSPISSSTPPTPVPVNPAPQVPAEDHDFPQQVGQGRVEVEVIPQASTSVLHWIKMPEHFPISSTIQLPTGTSVPMPRIQRAISKLSSNGADKERLAIIKGATEHAWAGYKEFAFGLDEVKPVSGRTNNPFNAWGATLVDSLDTLWIAGMKKEFEEAIEQVKKIDFTTSPRSDIPVFETVIRYLGGLIAAYDVSGKKYVGLLDKAVELGEVLFKIFDTPNRMPQTFYRWKPSFNQLAHRAGTRVVLAEIGTLSLEFTRLAQLTGEPKYYDAIARITDAFEEWQNSTRLPGMWPTQLDASGCGKPPAAPVINTMPDEDGRTMMTSEPVQVVDTETMPQKPKTPAKELPLPIDPTSENRKRQLRPVIDDSPRHRINEDVTTPHNDVRQLQTVGSEGEKEVCLPQGLVSSSKNAGETFTLSGASDSMYEYLPKEYLLLGGQVDKYRTMYLDSAAAAIEKLLYQPMTKSDRRLLLTGELRMSPNYSQELDERDYIESFKPEVAHLACFAGGMFAMGGVLFDKPEHVEIGSKLTDGCVWAYNATATGIMPEGAEVVRCTDTWGDCPWDEKAWWKALDPYAEERMKAQKAPVPSSSVSAVPQQSEAPAAAPAVAVNADHQLAGDAPQPPMPAQPDPQPKVDLRKDPDPESHLPKRQLVDKKFDVPSPPRPAPADLKLGVAQAQPGTPIYQPEKPLSHEEYVQKKIEEERLPPGYTRIMFRRYILRPEAIESVFYMYRITGDQYWRDVGWNMFTSINSHTQALHGNSAIDDITKTAPEQVDQMESFWLAETLKYFYLLYDDPDKWSLDDWVLNTEAHLFRRPKYEFADV